MIHAALKYVESYRREASPRLQLFYWWASARLAWSLLRICFRPRSQNRAEHIHNLEEKLARQAKEIDDMRRQAECKNIEMKAMNLLVACDGPCNRDLMDDPSQVTLEVVENCEYVTKRLRHWWDRGGVAAKEAYRNKLLKNGATK